ncbi:hypothetical protein V6582_00340 (plasmid) [Agrobacterium vitis]|uniref:hypothetical protein n=1 Tax=Agrobacterium vitis TaxID=373 RepID=UPI0012E70299|nr:hypothetical protein [Agrobacterium vitis]MVA27284.1 hypothetical protein [Agrobacterium vitis]
MKQFSLDHGLTLKFQSEVADALAEGRPVGPGLTKFIMRALDTATHGKTSRANAAVLVSTAQTAGDIAVALAEIAPQRNAIFQSVNS